MGGLTAKLGVGAGIALSVLCLIGLVHSLTSNSWQAKLDAQALETTKAIAIADAAVQRADSAEAAKARQTARADSAEARARRAEDRARKLALRADSAASEADSLAQQAPDTCQFYLDAAMRARDLANQTAAEFATSLEEQKQAAGELRAALKTDSTTIGDLRHAIDTLSTSSKALVKATKRSFWQKIKPSGFVGVGTTAGIDLHGQANVTAGLTTALGWTF